MKNYLAAFAHAWNGVKHFFQAEKNAPILVLFSAVALILTLFLNLSTTECLFVCLSICMVFSAEIFNTSIEHLADRVSKEHELAIKHVKDLSAAACLFTVLFAAIVGLVIFLPKIL